MSVFSVFNSTISLLDIMLDPLAMVKQVYIPAFRENGGKMKKILLILVLLLMYLGCLSAPPVSFSQCRVEVSSVSKPRGAALVVHGLNLNPVKMSTLIEFLNSQNIVAYNVFLPGHDTGLSSEERLARFKNVSFNLWQKDLEGVYREVRKYTEEENLPLYYVGFSLGGVLGCNLLTREVSFDKMILFSPALKVNRTSRLIQVFSPFDAMTIPSSSPREYRANDKMAVAGYNALFDAIEELEQTSGDRLNIPALLFIDREDELVSFQRTETFIEEKELDQWTLFPVVKDEGFKDIYHHLTIDPYTVGPGAWSEISRKMVLFLNL